MTYGICSKTNKIIIQNKEVFPVTMVIKVIQMLASTNTYLPTLCLNQV